MHVGKHPSHHVDYKTPIRILHIVLPIVVAQSASVSSQLARCGARAFEIIAGDLFSRLPGVHILFVQCLQCHKSLGLSRMFAYAELATVIVYFSQGFRAQ